MNVLVLGMGSNVSQGIAKALRGIQGIPIHLIGACIHKSSAGLYVCDEALISPLARDEAFVPWYIRTCREHDVAIAYTGVEENIDALVRNRERIEKECRTAFAYPDREVWETGYDKFRTCEWLKEHGIPYPDYALASDDTGVAGLIARAGFPLIAKPRGGKSSSGIIVARSLKDLAPVFGNSEYVVQECVGSANNEYTVGCYFDRQGTLRSRIIMHRYLKNGGTSIAEIVSDGKIDEAVGRIGSHLRMTGPLNIQFRLREDGTPVCFEWNVRYSGATAIRNHFGFCDVEAAIREYVLNEEDVSRCFHPAESGVAVRMDEERYFENTGFENLFRERVK